MTAYQGHHFGFLALGKGWQDLVDCQAPEANDSPSYFFTRRIRDDELLRRGVFQNCPDEIGCHHALPNPVNKVPARDLSSGKVRHFALLSLNFAPSEFPERSCGFLRTGSVHAITLLEERSTAPFRQRPEVLK